MCFYYEYPQHMFLSINEEHYQRFITKYPSLTNPLQKLTKHCPTNAAFPVKTGTEVIFFFFYFNVYSLLGKIFNRQHFEIFFLLSPESKLQHFMQIVTFRYNWYEMLSLFSGKPIQKTLSILIYITVKVYFLGKIRKSLSI